jgi:murein DD-endopeptidase MepM/ murein hydrolase activator NlpD
MRISTLQFFLTGAGLLFSVVAPVELITTKSLAQSLPNCADISQTDPSTSSTPQECQMEFTAEEATSGADPANALTQQQLADAGVTGAAQDCYQGEICIGGLDNPNINIAGKPPGTQYGGLTITDACTLSGQCDPENEPLSSYAVGFLDRETIANIVLAIGLPNNTPLSQVPPLAQAAANLGIPVETVGEALKYTQFANSVLTEVVNLADGGFTLKSIPGLATTVLTKFPGFQQFRINAIKGLNKVKAFLKYVFIPFKVSLVTNTPEYGVSAYSNMYASGVTTNGGGNNPRPPGEGAPAGYVELTPMGLGFLPGMRMAGFGVAQAVSEVGSQVAQNVKMGVSTGGWGPLAALKLPEPVGVPIHEKIKLFFWGLNAETGSFKVGIAFPICLEPPKVPKQTCTSQFISLPLSITFSENQLIPLPAGAYLDQFKGVAQAGTGTPEGTEQNTGGDPDSPSSDGSTPSTDGSTTTSTSSTQSSAGTTTTTSSNPSGGLTSTVAPLVSNVIGGSSSSSSNSSNSSQKPKPKPQNQSTASSAGTSTGKLINPAPGYPTSSEYGMRKHPITGAYKMHHGIDISMPDGKPVKASDGGRVVYAGWIQGYGKTVIVCHSNGLATLYAHLQDFRVKVGEGVSQGQVVATSDSSGNVTGPHLHFEIIEGMNPDNPLVSGQAVNPRKYIRF